jgi:hypothetical protein
MSLTKASYSMIQGASLNVLDFGASPSASAATNLTAIQAALTYANSIGGARVFVPAGNYAVSGTLNIYKKTILCGDGQQTSILTFTNTGVGIASTWPINSSTAVWISVEDIGLICTNAANTGAGFADIGGTFVYLYKVYIEGFKYGVIFDQTELADIYLCDINEPRYAAIWLVNGVDYAAGAAGYTNRIAINNNQISGQLGATYGIIDDGGASHSFRDNNYNGFVNHIRVAGVLNLLVSGGEFEASTQEPIIFRTTRLSGAGSAPGASTTPNMNSLFMIPPSTFGAINFSSGSASSSNINSCAFSNTGGAAALTGFNNISAATVIMCASNSPLYDALPSSIYNILQGGGALISQSQYISVTVFTNGWGNYGLPYPPMAYAINPFGVVQLRGAIASGGSNSIAFTLPVGYRPPYKMLYTVPVSITSSTYGTVTIDTTGEVYVESPNVLPVSLNSISFYNAI